MAGGSVKLSIYSTFKDDGTKKAERAIDAFAKRFGKLDEKTGVKTIDDATRALLEQSTQADLAAARWQGYSDKLGAAGVAITKYVSAGAGAVAGASVKLASDFEDSYAKVKTIMDKSAVAPEKMSADILKLSTETGKAATELNEAVYQSISASVETEKAVGFTADAVNLAKAGFTDTSTAVDTLTTTINAYKMSADDAGAISDKLVQTQNKGKTTVDELGSSLGAVIPTAAAYGVSLDNLLTGYVELTKQGINTANATTALNGMLTELADDGSVVNGILQDMSGKTFGELMSSGASLGDVMSMLMERAGGNSEEFANLWSNVRASKAALALANAGADEFNAELDAMATCSGNVSAALEDLVTPSSRANKAMNAMKNTGIELGEQFLGALAPALETGASKAQELFGWFSSLDQGTKQAIASVTGVAAAAGPAVLGLSKMAGGVSSALSAYGDLTAKLAKVSAEGGRFAGVAGTLGTALSGPVVAGALAAGAAVAVVATAAYDAWKRADELEGATTRLTEACTSGAPSLEAASAGILAIGQASGRAAVDVDGLTRAQSELASEIAERNSQAQSDINRLESARQVLDRYMNTTVEGAQAQGQFRAAIATVNELCGTQYEVVDAANGKVADERGEILETCGAIDEYIAKKQQQIRADALTENLGDLYKQQADDIAAVAEKTEALRRAQADLAAAEDAGMTGETWQAYADNVSTAEAELAKAQSNFDSCTKSIEATEEMLGNAAAAADDADASLSTLASGNSVVAGYFGEATDDLSAFCGSLEAAGVSTERFRSLSDTELLGLAQSWRGSTDDIRAYMDGLASEMPGKGEAAAQGAADGIASGQGAVSAAAGGLASAAEGPVDGAVGGMYTAGGDMSDNLASGISSGSGVVSTAAGKISSAASAMGNGDSSTWGSHLVQSFASGMRSAAHFIDEASSFIGGKVSAFLGHSVPKRGPLHVGGMGEALWGEHAAENFARGARNRVSYVEGAFAEVAAAAEAGMRMRAPAGAFQAAPGGMWAQAPLQAQAAQPQVVENKTEVYVDGSMLDVGGRVATALDDFLFELEREMAV